MQTEKQPITKAELLSLANQMIKEHDDYLAGMAADDVEQKSGVMVFKGDYFLDENGLPTPKTMALFNVFKFLAHQLSEKYYLLP